MPGNEPVRVLPELTWEHQNLYVRIKDAISALPFYFRTETIISGLMATDIFTLNATLGATIEDQVVSTLNEMRPIWDPDGKYKIGSRSLPQENRSYRRQARG
jgi:hypothetical protein